MNFSQGQLEKKAKTLKIIVSKFHNFLPSQILQTCKSRQPKLKSRQNCTANFLGSGTTPKRACKLADVFPSQRRILS
ncbi:hypothetical protein ACE6H2_019155 [Prunus campanulata]